LSKRVGYWLGVLAGVGLLAAGVVIGISGYAATAGPDGAVRGYFAALARGDAPAALGFGDLPGGPHTLLTSTVLHDQQRIAPLRDVQLKGVRQSGDRATVSVSYALAFPGDRVVQHVTIRLHHKGGWRLDATAVPLQLDVGAAVRRMSIVGAGIPAGRTLVFPGALPIRFDTPYLELDPSVDVVRFGSPQEMVVAVRPTEAARSAMLAAARGRLQTCVTGRPDPTCPLPSERYVPGSLHGAVVGGLHAWSVRLEDTDPNGSLRLTGRATVRGSYRRLDFHNIAVRGSGTVDVPLSALAYAVPPLVFRWAEP
jgi:hypothetical protein